MSGAMKHKITGTTLGGKSPPRAEGVQWLRRSWLADFMP